MKTIAAKLGRWLRTWVQPNGAIHGFHNHSVWGENPYRLLDFTAGHSTFAAPFMLGLAAALRQRPDHRGRELLERIARFQAGSIRGDGQFKHVGFQLGESEKPGFETTPFGLIHNVVPCLALAAVAPDLAPALREEAGAAVRKVLSTCDRLYQPGPHENTTANQEYARLWAQLAHMEAFGHGDWDHAVREALDYLIAKMHVRGLPDHESAATYRSQSDLHKVEPAEYYGLMMAPLLLAGRRYGEERYTGEARAIARYVIRSAWKDAHGQVRLHRFWIRAHDSWRRVCEPMLIGGMGLTLAGIEALARHRPDPEFSAFLDETDATYRHYQHEAGFFLAASGWEAEPDIVPASAWQGHDFFHLVVRHGVDESFWDTVFSADEATAVVFGKTMIWAEDGVRWALFSYDSMYHAGAVYGRKDTPRFGFGGFAWEDRFKAPEECRWPEAPRFIRTDAEIHHVSGRRDLRVFLAADLHYDGPRLDPSPKK